MKTWDQNKDDIRTIWADLLNTLLNYLYIPNIGTRGRYNTILYYCTKTYIIIKLWFVRKPSYGSLYAAAIFIPELEFNLLYK